VTKKKPQRNELPRIRRHRWKESGWLILEPSRIGAIAGCFFSGVAALVYLVRQQLGIPMAIADVALGVAKSFVVSYVAAGVFVLYLLWIAERELLPPDEPKKRRGLKGDKAVRADDSPADPEAAQGSSSDVDVLTEALERINSGGDRDSNPRPTE
jgi:hypothetical protein